jgi:hypothetical protein
LQWLQKFGSALKNRLTRIDRYKNLIIRYIFNYYHESKW